MKTLYSDWLSCINNGVSPKLDSDTTQCFYKSLEATYTMAFAPMLVDARGTFTSQGYQQYQGWGGNPIDYDHDSPTWVPYLLKWLKLSQMTDYAKYCLNPYKDEMTDLFLSTIDIWKGYGNVFDMYGLSDSNCPMNQQWMPQAFRFGEKYSELSSLQGTDMQPWWSTPPFNEKYFGDPSFDGLRYTVYNGPYLPSSMNHQWYDASWRALCKLINTPSIAIGGSQKGWFWINPLYRGDNAQPAFQLSSFENSPLSDWQEIDDILEPFDKQICGGNISAETMPYSVCGLPIGEAVYTSDLASYQKSDPYFNAPLLEPLDQIREFFGANRTFAEEYVGIHNIQYKFPSYFLNKYQFGQWQDIMYIGTDQEHWGQLNTEGRWPEYSFVSKPYRTAQNTLEETCLQDDLKGNICTPPLRLVAENVFAHQWLWQAFLEGTSDVYWSKLSPNTIAWTPFKFTRPHYFRDYSFNVTGEAKLSSDGGANWFVEINQTWNTTSKSDFQWIPLEELAGEEPALAHLEPNTLKYYNSSSYGESVIPGNPYPKGTTNISCLFEIPLPLSVDGNCAVFDSTYISSSGYTEEEWKDIVRITKSMFPATAQWKRDKELKNLQESYDSQYGYLYGHQQELYNELAQVEKQEESLGVYCWFESWRPAVEKLWPDSTEFQPWEHYNDGISATSTWTGDNPQPFENFMSNWAGTYWDLHGYMWGSYLMDVGSFENAPLNNIEDCDWTKEAYEIYDNFADEISQSKLIKDGQTSAYYSDETIQEIRASLSGMVNDMVQNGYSALQASGSLLQQIQNQYPPLTCTITTDPETGAETSTYTQDENAWKRVVIAMNNNLSTYTHNWYHTSRSNLLNADSGWDYEWDDDVKQQHIDQLSSVIDPVMKQAWTDEYEECVQAWTEWCITRRNELLAEINSTQDEIDALQAWYEEEYERIMGIQDDPLPTIKDLNKFLHYNITGGPTQPKTQWSASMTMFAICPDTYTEPLSNYTEWGDTLIMRDQYVCDYPTTRWPYIRDEAPTKYMVGLKKTSLDEVIVDGKPQLQSVTKGRVWVDDESHSSFKFDEFRYKLYKLIEEGIAADYFGTEGVPPKPHQFFGSGVRDPNRWTIHEVLKIDTSMESKGIEGVEYGDTNNINVRFVNNGHSEEWECRKIRIFIVNGPTVYTQDCVDFVKRSWSQTSTLPWKFAEDQTIPEYYNRPPIADDDYTLPELSGQLEINVGQQVIGSMNNLWLMESL